MLTGPPTHVPSATFPVPPPLLVDLTEFDDVEAMTAIIRITGGNFRLVQRLFAQMARIMDINHLEHVTKEVVEAARGSLVIGVTRYPSCSPRALSSMKMIPPPIITITKIDITAEPGSRYWM